MAGNDKRKALETVFDLFDKDKSGKIDAGELRAAIRAYYTEIGEKADDGQVDADVGSILAACDTSKDGKIDKTEWFKFFEV